MTYFVIESFGHGLDLRKHIMALPPGSLYGATNVVINRGGEPESSKAFVLYWTLPPNTFGFMQAGGNLFIFGSDPPPWVPNGIVYQQLVHPSAGNMTGVVWQTVIKGKPFVVASFANGTGVFFNGALVTEWLPPGVSALKGAKIFPFGKRRGVDLLDTPASWADLAVNLATQINTNPTWTASASGSTVTVTGKPNEPYSFYGSNPQGAIDLAILQNAAPSGPDVKASCTITYNGVHATGVDYVWAQIATSLKINGVEVLPHLLAAPDDLSAAQTLASSINSFHSSPQYSATYSGNVVTIKAPPSFGATPNGYSVVLQGDGGTASPNPTQMLGGSGPDGGAGQITTFTFGGAFDPAKPYSITLNNTTFTQAAVLPPPSGDGGDPSTGGGDPGGAGGGVFATAGISPTCVLTKNSKTYAIAGPNLFGSEVGDCTKWNGTTGSFITDMSSELAGAEALTALALFQGNLAVFSRSTVQLWNVDPDPALNTQLQVMQNMGTMAPKSVVPFGDSDVFFLSDTGIRSLKVRVATNNVTVSDIGSPIDPAIISLLQAFPTAAPYYAGVMEPVDGRYILTMGGVTYAFSYFPDAKVGAWTVMQGVLRPTDYAVLNNRLYARGNTAQGDADAIYLLGGANNATYSTQAMDIKIPFLSARQIATVKHFTAIDVVCDGTFDVYLSTDPLQPNAEELIATITGTTLSLGVAPFSGEDVTAIALHLVGRSGQYGRISSIIVHYEALRENA